MYMPQRKSFGLPRKSFGPTTNTLGINRDPATNPAVRDMNSATSYYNDLLGLNKQNRVKLLTTVFDTTPHWDDATTAESRVRRKQVNALGNQINEIIKNDYGMKLLDNKAQYLGTPIPRDVLSFKVADFLQRAPDNGLRNALTRMPGSTAASVTRAEQAIQSALEYPDLVNRDIIDRVNI